MSEVKVPVIVLGGTGYVAGELLRLIAAHPKLELKAVLSDSQPGESVAKSFAHLAPIYPELKFSSLEQVTELVGTLPQSAILSAAPHGVAARLIDGLLTEVKLLPHDTGGLVGEHREAYRQEGARGVRWQALLPLGNLVSVG